MREEEFPKSSDHSFIPSMRLVYHHWVNKTKSAERLSYAKMANK